MHIYMCGCQGTCNSCHQNRPMYKLYYKTRNLVNTVYVDNSERVNYVTDPLATVYRGMSVRRMTNSNYLPLNNTKIYFSGERQIPINPNSGITAAQYFEKLLIQTPHGEIEASTLYDDGGTGFETTIEYVDYYVNHASKHYKKARRVRIIFDNDGNIFGPKYSRVVEIYQ